MITTSRSARRGLVWLPAGLAAALAMTACSAEPGPQGGTASESAGASSGPLTVASADFPENQVIAEIYAGALKAAGIEADTRLNVGSRETYYTAVVDGSVDIVPGYSGNLLHFAHPEATAESAEDILAALPDALAASSPEANLGVLEAAEAQNKDTMVVTAATAEEYGLTSLEDMAEVCGELVIGAPSSFAERTDGLPGLEEKYGCVPRSFEAINDGGGALTLEALLNDTIQVADIYTTTPSITDNALVVLEDPAHNFMAQQVVPLVRLDTVGQDAQAVLNEVSNLLTTEHLIDLNREVSGEEKRDPADAAADWLEENGLAAE